MWQSHWEALSMHQDEESKRAAILILGKCRHGTYPFARPHRSNTIKDITSRNESFSSTPSITSYTTHLQSKCKRHGIMLRNHTVHLNKDKRHSIYPAQASVPCITPARLAAPQPLHLIIIITSYRILDLSCVSCRVCACSSGTSPCRR